MDHQTHRIDAQIIISLVRWSCRRLSSINDVEEISATSVRNSEFFKRRPLAVVLGVIGGSERLTAELRTSYEPTAISWME